jgi:hypothetical protein
MPSHQHLYDLRDLIEMRGRDTTERLLNVHRTTIKRWLDGSVKMPEATRLMVRMLLGHLPGTEGQWEGWRFWKGELHSPEGERFRVGDLTGLRYERLAADAARRELAEARATIADLVRERAVRDVAANDAAEVRQQCGTPR